MTLNELRVRVSEAWHRLGTPDAINWVSILLVTVMFISSGFGANVVVIQGREWIFAFISFAGIAALGLGIWAFRWLITLIPRASVRPWATLVAFELANVIRSWVFDELFVAFDFGDTHRLLYRIATGQISGVLGLTLAGILVPYARAFTRANRDLSDAVRALDDLRLDAEMKFETQRAHLTTRVRSALEVGLKPLTGLVAETDARTLRSAIDDVVRPLSYRLSFQTGNFDQVGLRSLTRKIRWRKIVTSTLTSQPVHPIPFLVWVAFIVAQVAFVFELDNAWLGAIASVGASAVVLFATRWIWARLSNPANVVARSLSLTAVLGAVGLICSVSVEFILGGDWFAQGNWAWACVQAIFIGWSIALVAGASAIYRHTNRDLTTALDSLRHQIASMNGATRQLQRDVSRIVHGPIQDAIAVALRRAESLRPGEQLSPGYVQEVRAQIESALENLVHSSETERGAPGDDASIVDMISDLQVMWSDSVRIVYKISPEDVSVLDSATTKTLFEIIREATSNGILHGDAHLIEIQISCDLPHRIARVTISNDGASLPDNPVLGLGSHTMTELTISWSRTQVDASVVVAAVVPLQPGLPSGADHS